VERSESGFLTVNVFCPLYLFFPDSVLLIHLFRLLNHDWRAMYSKISAFFSFKTEDYQAPAFRAVNQNPPDVV
jgi:hypothetical protein